MGNIDITYCGHQSYGFNIEHPAAPIWTFRVSDPDPKKAHPDPKKADQDPKKSDPDP